MKGNQADHSKQQLNEIGIPQMHSKLLKSFDSIGSVGKKSSHKRYKSSGGSSNKSSFSNESTHIYECIILTFLIRETI